MCNEDSNVYNGYNDIINGNIINDNGVIQWLNEKYNTIQY